MKRIKFFNENTSNFWDDTWGNRPRTEDRYTSCAERLEGMASILNLGCGMDNIAENLGNKVHCLDMSKEALKYQQQFTEKTTHTSDVHSLPFPDNAFDCVFASHLIEHLDTPIGALKEWIRVSKKKIVLIMPKPHAEHAKDDRHLWTFEYADWVSLQHQFDDIREVVFYRDFDLTLDLLLQKKQKVSIIIPFYKQLDVLENCLRSIRLFTQYPNYEIILVNDGEFWNGDAGRSADKYADIYLKFK